MRPAPESRAMLSLSKKHFLVIVRNKFLDVAQFSVKLLEVFLLLLPLRVLAKEDRIQLSTFTQESWRVQVDRSGFGDIKLIDDSPAGTRK